MLLKLQCIIFLTIFQGCTGADPLLPVDLFGSGVNEWYLAFRGTPYIGQSVYDAYLHGSENVDAACKQTEQNLPCKSHYRSSLLDNWKNIGEVAFVIYKDGNMQKYAIFEGSGTNNVDWFSERKLKSSNWADLQGETHNYISLYGDDNWDRRLFINHNYDGCDSDAGWFVAVDSLNTPCDWEDTAAFPMFLYANGDSYENWSHGSHARADFIAIYIKYSEPEELEFVDLFETGQREWRLAFRGTSHINKPVYDAYFHGNQNVDVACKQTDSSFPCSSHYRSSILDDWKNIAEVAFVIFKSGVMQKYAVFDGVGTNNVNWFSGGKLKRSSWADLTGNSQYFSIEGDSYFQRRFFINAHYGGCDSDDGWFVAVDQHDDDRTCGWEDVKSYPLFLYSASSTHENWSQGKFAEADVMAVFVKFGTPNIIIG